MFHVCAFLVQVPSVKFSKSLRRDHVDDDDALINRIKQRRKKIIIYKKNDALSGLRRVNQNSRPYLNKLPRSSPLVCWSDLWKLVQHFRFFPDRASRTPKISLRRRRVGGRVPWLICSYSSSGRKRVCEVCRKRLKFVCRNSWRHSGGPLPTGPAGIDDQIPVLTVPFRMWCNLLHRLVVVSPWSIVALMASSDRRTEFREQGLMWSPLDRLKLKNSPQKWTVPG